MEIGNDQPRDVGNIGHQQGVGLVGDGAQTLEIDRPGVCGGTTDDELRLVLERELAQALVVDGLGLLVDPVGNDLELLARVVERMAVGEVTSMGEVHTKQGVTRLHDRQVDTHVGLGT